MRALRSPWTCRPFLQFFVILATISTLLHSLESPLPAAGKMYPRGNHWAVGHLMGKKSVRSAASLQRADYEHDVIRDSQTEEAAPRLQRRTHNLKPQQLQPLRSRWRRENVHLREIIDLLLMALKVTENGSI